MTDKRLDECIDNISKVIGAGKAFRDKFNERFDRTNGDIWARRNATLDGFLDDVINRRISKTMRKEFKRYIAGLKDTDSDEYK